MKTTDELISEIPLETKNELLSYIFNKLISSHPFPWTMDRDWGYNILDNNNKEIFHCLRDPDFANFIINFSKDFDEQSRKEYEEVLKEATGDESNKDTNANA